MSRTVTQPQHSPNKVWVLKTKVPIEWKELIDRKMRELGFYTYDEFLRQLVRKAIGV